MLRETSDISLSAYIRLKIKENPDLGIENIGVDGQRGSKFNFKFEDHSGVFDDLSMQYSSSESFAHDNEIRILKTLLKSKQ